MAIIIPQNRKWTQTNSGEVFGTLNSSYNVNFDHEGVLQVSPKSVSLYSNTDDSDFDLPLSMFPFDGGYFILTADDPFSLGANMTLTQIAGAPNDIGRNSDALSWQSRAYVTTTDDLVYWNGSSWTTGLKTLTSSIPHPLEVMGNFSGGHLVVANGNTLLRLDSSHNTVATLTLNSNYQITCLKYHQSNVYIGTKTLNGREAKVFVWNGSETSAQSEYGVAASWVFALEVHQGGIVCATSEGQIIPFSGGGFGKELANFPVYYSNYRWVDSSTDTRRIQCRGMRSDGNMLYINIDGAVSFRDSYFYLANQPSGVWCLDPNVGLYCRHLSTTDPLQTISVSSVSDSILTLASSVKAVTGEPVLISAVGSLTGVTVRVTYYVIKVSETTIKLAASPANALAGTAITLGGSAGAATIKIIGYNDYGQKSLNGGSAGAIGLVDSGIGTYSGSFFQEIVSTIILWGVEIGSEQHLNCLSAGSNIGGFVTNKIWSLEVTDFFKKLFVKYQGVNLTHEKIIIKARASETFGLPTEEVAGTFSTTRVLGSGSVLLGQVEDGNNINIISGNGAGQSVSIVEIDGAEYELSEALPNVTSADAVTFNVDNFKILDNQGDEREFYEVSLGDEFQKSWIQIMGELRGQNVQIEELQLVHGTKKESK